MGVQAPAGTQLSYSASAFGIRGDGTDETAKIQAFFNIIAATVGNRGVEAYFPLPAIIGGFYGVSATLAIPDVRGFRIVGESMNACEIRMSANNTPILKTSGQFQRSLSFEELTLSYANQQNFAAHPLSACIELQSPAGGSACFYSTFGRLYLLRASYGIHSTAAGFSVWGNVFREIQSGAIEHSLVTLTPAVGQPVNLIQGIRHTAEGGPVPTGTALDLLNEFVIDGADIEDWTGPVITIANGPFSVRGVHLERYTAQNNIAAFTVNGLGTFDDIEVSGSAANAITGIIYNANLANITIGHTRLDLTTAGSGQWVHHIANAGSVVEAIPPFVNSGVLAFFMYPNAATLAATVVRPVPGIANVASAAALTLPDSGELFQVTGGTGITSIPVSWNRRVTLRFAAALTVTNGSNLKLNGNFVATASGFCTLTLFCDGTNWTEICRTII